MSWKTRLEQLLQERIEQRLWRNRVAIASPQGRFVTVAGQSLLNFCSNDYLGLASHPDLAKAGTAAIKQWGSGSGASHLICGHQELHEQLESKLATFVGAEKALVFSTGYMANLALPQALLDRHGLLLEDKLNHASLLDAGQLAAATMRRYPHLDVQSAERMLAESDAPQKMVMTDGVFSMDGDIAPVVELREICNRHHALLVVDEAHGLGVLGDQGGGVCQQHGISITDNVLLMGTLGKSAGSFGAFVAGDRFLIDSLVQLARPYIYTTALPPAVVGTSLAAVEVMKSEPWRREKLRDNVQFFRELAESHGLFPGNSTTPIQPIMVGSADNAIRVSNELKNNGIWVVAIRPPTVPVGSARLRVTLTAEHEHEDIDRLIECMTSREIGSFIGEAVL
jgi:8-amino-7-oxononanoate synthase